MTPIPRIFPLAGWILLLIMASSCLGASAIEAAKARSVERLPHIDELKLEGKVGENARGYLAERKPLGPREAALVEDENEDRRILYASVAARTNESIDQVGKQRALRLAELAKEGIWLQNLDGIWYQKGAGGG